MKKIKITTIILAIILITMIAFTGVYIKTQNRMENKVKEYQLSRELKGGRVIEIKVATKDEATQPSAEDYEIVKNTIEKRLKNLGAPDYTISLNKENGTIRVELAEDELIDTYAYFLTAENQVQIKEKDTDTVLLSDSMVKKAMYTYTADMENSYQVFLELHLTKEGQTKIEEIQNNYAIFANEIEEIEASKTDVKTEKSEEAATDETTEATSENEEKKEETKKIAKLTIAGNEYKVEKIEKNKIRVRIGEKTTNTTNVNQNISTGAQMALLINSGKYPVQYEISENRFVASDITEQQMIYFALIIAAVLFVVFIIFIIKYKVKGLLASISYIGFISILLLLLRYTNVNISIEGIGAIILVLIINIRINQIILNKIKIMNIINEAFTSTYKEVFLKIIPVIIITLVFCFAGISNLSSFGMIMFWGLLLIAGYNMLVTKTLLKLKESK